MSSIVCCGSKRYEHIDLSELVDSFDTIVRHNMMINTSIYGSRPSDIQILNSHIDENRKKNMSEDDWVEHYMHIVGSEGPVREFYRYLTNIKSTTYIYYGRNNQAVLNRVLTGSGFSAGMKKMPRCGLSHVAELIQRGEKPYLIGYSLNKDDGETHQHNRVAVSLAHHSPDCELDIIKHLHNKELIDATLCCIEDTVELSLSDEILHRLESLEILEKVYGYCK